MDRLIICDYSGHKHTIESFDIAMEQRKNSYFETDLDKCLNRLMSVASRNRSLRDTPLSTFVPHIMIIDSHFCTINMLFSTIAKSTGKQPLLEALSYYRTHIEKSPSYPGKEDALEFVNAF